MSPPELVDLSVAVAKTATPGVPYAFVAKDPKSRDSLFPFQHGLGDELPVVGHRIHDIRVADLGYIARLIQHKLLEQRAASEATAFVQWLAAQRVWLDTREPTPLVVTRFAKYRAEQEA